MNVMLIAFGLFATSCFAQSVVWRIRLPRKHTPALLVLFALVPVVAMFLGLVFHRLSFTPYDVVRIALLYVSFALGYVVIYSALEQQSPTLSIVAYVRKRGAAGCADSELFDVFGEGRALEGRLDVMSGGGWAEIREGRFKLTSSGRFFANSFALAARVFGLPTGG